jgi:outer membrane protein assembly factor BamB
MTLTRFTVVVFLLICQICPPARSQTNRRGTPVHVPGPPVFEELDGTSRTQFERAEALIQGGQADEAIEALRQVVDTDADKVVAATRQPIAQLSGFSQYITAREYGLIQLSKLQAKFPQEFTAYRRQLDAVADRWLEQGIATRDETMLRRLIREAFLSRSGDDALLALGEFALERGEYNVARNDWERIHPTLRFPATNDARLRPAVGRPLWLSLRGVDLKVAWPALAPLLEMQRGQGDGDRQQEEKSPPELDWLVYPDTELNLDEVRARLALASIFEGNHERATIEIGILRQISSQAQGTIAGRQGNLVQLLENFLSESRTWPATRHSPDWTTYTGSPTRQYVSNLELPDVSQPFWTLRLPRLSYPQELLTANRARVAERSDGVLSYHPLILGDRVVVQAGQERNQIVICQLEAGEPIVTAAFNDADDSQESGRGIFGVPRFTTTSAGDMLFVRNGIPLSVAPANRARASRPARLEALSVSADGKLLWDFAPQGSAWGDDWTVGGPPVTDGSQLYVALIRRGPLRVETHLAALDLVDGRLRWRRFLSAAEPAFDDTVSLLTHTLLTLDHGVIYCNTNHGTIAACQTDGTIKWLSVYPRAPLSGVDPDRNDLHFYRDSNPCLVYQDLVIVAPTDCNRIFALDANTGAPIWATQEEVAADVVHFLGVSDNNLIASGECLYWLDVYTGRFVGQFPNKFLPAPGFARPSPRGYGRGLLAGSHVYWPTYESILVFEQRAIRSAHGWEPVPIREIPLAASGVTGGNLVAANGILLIAGADQMAAFRTRPQSSSRER